MEGRYRFEFAADDGYQSAAPDASAKPRSASPTPLIAQPATASASIIDTTQVTTPDSAVNLTITPTVDPEHDIDPDAFLVEVGRFYLVGPRQLAGKARAGKQRNRK